MFNRLITSAGAAVCALALSGCASLQSLDGVGARLLASDASIVDVALAVHRVRGIRLNLREFDDRVIAYRAVDSYMEFRAGKISEAEFIAEVDALIAEVQR